MKPAPFVYHAPDTVDEVVKLLADLGDEGKVLAGGQSLMPMLAMRLAAFGHLVDVGRVEELKGAERRGEELWVGAATQHAIMELHPDVVDAVPLLARVTPMIGHFQIRNRGTVGGSVAHADPAAEFPAVALTLDATLEATSVRGTRDIAAADFFDGVWTTTMEPDEVLTGLRFPLRHSRSGFGAQEFARRHGDFAIAGATVAIELDDEGRVERCAVGLIGMGPTPLRARAAEAAALGNPVQDVDPEELGRAAVADLEGIPADLQGPPEFRRRIGAVMTARAWKEATREALGG